jgi:hypothetical protein
MRNIGFSRLRGLGETRWRVWPVKLKSARLCIAMVPLIIEAVHATQFRRLFRCDAQSAAFDTTLVKIQFCQSIYRLEGINELNFLVRYE